MNELKPCSFCGGSPRLDTYLDYDDFGHADEAIRIRCTKCPACMITYSEVMGGEGQARKYLTRKWNAGIFDGGIRSVWIPCDKILPEGDEIYNDELIVLIVYKTPSRSFISMACRVIEVDGDWVWDYGEGSYCPAYVSHWMPLPGLPLLPENQKF